MLPGDGDADVDAEHAGEDSGGSSVASWNNAVDLAWAGWMPRVLSRCPRWLALMGLPGRPPGKQPGGGRVSCGSGVPAASGQVLPGEGAGSVIGAGPRRIVTWVPAVLRWLVVSRLIRAVGWA